MSKVMAPPDLVVKKRPGPTSLAMGLSESEGSESTGSATTTVPSSPASFESDYRTFSLTSIKGRTWRSLSGKERESPPDLAKASSFRTHARRLSKSRPLSSSSHIDGHHRRGSSISEDYGRASLSTSDSLSLANATSSSSSINWEGQRIEGCAPLEPDTLLLKTKTPYLVVTTDYLVKTKSRADALALLPSLGGPGGGKHDTNGSTPAPSLVIPTAAIISVFAAESTRPSFGIEVWWRSPLAGHSFCRSDFFFTNPTERNEQMHHITRAMRASQQDENGPARHCQNVEAVLVKVHEAEEPKFHHRKPDVFPVVPRGNTRKEYMPKPEDATKKPQEGPAFYLVVGTYLCHLVEIQKGKGGEPTCRHKSYGLVTLESFKGEWILHEERFNITFRDPFKPPVTLELASRYFRQIIRVFGTADRFLKPAWPQLWQTMEIFHVSGLKEPQYLVPKEDFGSFKRTLDAYLAAYRCEDVDWEINWKTRFAPEFRLLPAKRGSYSPLQLLAVLRALRYNDYFISLSFRDVDLSVLYGLQDNTLRRVNVAYLSRTCMSLGPEEIEMLRISPVLHQEFHALAFCSETIRQMDLTNCSRSLQMRFAQYKNQIPSLQFLAPLLNLLKTGITKCNRLLIGGNALTRFDIDDLAETMKSGVLQALDVSYCGLDDASMRDMIVLPLTEYPGLLQSLSVSGNPGRLPAHVLPGLFQYLTEIRELNLSGSIQAESYIEGSLLPFAALERMEMLEELDISGYKVDPATFDDLERFLHHRSRLLDEGQTVRFHKLVLNHCGITGTQAARLFYAIGINHGMHLCLSGNPIEHGISDLAATIRSQHGPAGLYLEMIEFKDEPNYLTLLSALTATQHLTLLSLAGTAPSPSSPGPCSDDLVATLHTFFARNASIKYLDLSGFSGKLDDGQLPMGAGGSLSGLAANHTLTHLRIRNQNLHDDAGALGRALAENGTLLSVDCRDNNLNLTSLRFLVDSLRGNSASRVVDFPMPRQEREAIWRNVLRGLQRTPSSLALSSLKAEGTVSAAAGAAAATANGGGGGAIRDLLRDEERLLREVLERQFGLLEERLRENRARLEARKGEGEERTSSMLSLEMGAQRRHRHQRSSSSTALGLLSGEDGWPGFELAADAGPTRSSSMGSDQDASLPAPYGCPAMLHDATHGSVRVVGGMESPTETLDPVSEVETPAEEKDQEQVRVVEEVSEAGRRSPGESDVVEDEVFRKMVDDFRRAGFEV
ncbi:hypothetical protein VTI74DRAFT_3306 [Chaetomium olivicolor]